ncbi:hypothetical protein DPEC_G00025410 [Dallia pectoralis]|uniref:Uncharacterized protein n=1 Tax=Dallia pectoralis TaxID=75939 RepID=A0ACC2HH81_DALPE|nr:hypothetical protein DPEC_G00025410 [Dallia pectoralis]
MEMHKRARVILTCPHLSATSRLHSRAPPEHSNGKEAEMERQAENDTTKGRNREMARSGGESMRRDQEERPGGETRTGDREGRPGGETREDQERCSLGLGREEE